MTRKLAIIFLLATVIGAGLESYANTLVAKTGYYLSSHELILILSPPIHASMNHIISEIKIDFISATMNFALKFPAWLLFLVPSVGLIWASISISSPKDQDFDDLKKAIDDLYSTESIYSIDTEEISPSSILSETNPQNSPNNRHGVYDKM
tara:strand:- start:187 stop:639 length:453 start_codon:yes stop_codon:yes gene_type:complete